MRKYFWFLLISNFGHDTRYVDVFMIFLSTSSEMPGQYLNLSKDRFLPHTLLIY
jgi:hypothetical protein